MQKVVLDTDVVVAAVRSALGGSNALMLEVAKGRLAMMVTPALFLEYEAVLKRPEQRLAHGLSIAAIDRFLATIADMALPVDVSFQWRPQLRDANDEMVLEAALNGRADVLVTHNVKDYRLAADKFALTVMRPGELLKELRK